MDKEKDLKPSGEKSVKIPLSDEQLSQVSGG
jgi:bacteriocin-like protein